MLHLGIENVNHRTEERGSPHQSPVIETTPLGTTKYFSYSEIIGVHAQPTLGQLSPNRSSSVPSNHAPSDRSLETGQQHHHPSNTHDYMPSTSNSADLTPVSLPSSRHLPLIKPKPVTVPLQERGISPRSQEHLEDHELGHNPDRISVQQPGRSRRPEESQQPQRKSTRSFSLSTSEKNVLKGAEADEKAFGYPQREDSLAPREEKGQTHEYVFDDGRFRPLYVDLNAIGTVNHSSIA